MFVRKPVDTVRETAPDAPLGFAAPLSTRLLAAMAAAASILQLRREYRAQIERAEADHAECQRGVEGIRQDIASGALDSPNLAVTLAERKAKQEVSEIRLGALREQIEATIPSLTEASEVLAQARRAWAVEAVEAFKPVYMAALDQFAKVCYEGIALSEATGDGLLADLLRRNRAWWPGADANLFRWFETRHETAPDATTTVTVEPLWRRDTGALATFERHAGASELCKTVTAELRTAAAKAEE